MEIRRAGVIGAGVMGSGIAAHVANAGIPVVLLDMVRPAPGPRCGAIEKAKPAPLMRRRRAARHSRQPRGRLGCSPTATGSSRRWSSREVKQYVSKPSSRRADAIVCSNTSTIPLAELARDPGSPISSTRRATCGCSRWWATRPAGRRRRLRRRAPRQEGGRCNDTPASSPTASAPSGSRWRRGGDRPRPHRRGGRRGHRPPDAPRRPASSACSTWSASTSARMSPLAARSRPATPTALPPRRC